jgi:polyhydroxybutyrate depolymerase
MSLRSLLALLLALCASPQAAACGREGAACTLPSGLGTYRVERPTGRDAVPAVVILHGWGGTGVQMLSDRGTVAALTARGWAVVAPDGQPREGRPGGGWMFRADRPGMRDETAFLRAVADDAAARFGLDRGRMVLAGFSVGGSMVAYAACSDPGAFAAYAPVAGTFWRPQPAACKGPVALFHTHGWTDRTFPLEGRAPGSGAMRQGDSFAALELFRTTNGCATHAPDETMIEGERLFRAWTRCKAPLAMLLHPGTHNVPAGWADRLLDWLETQPPAEAP